MTQRKALEPLRKVTLNLFEEDYFRLAQVYPDLPIADVIRQIIRNHLSKVDRVVAESVTPVTDLQLDLPLA